MRANYTNETKVIKVFSRRVALELRRKGFKIIKTEVNFKWPQFDVYCFENSEKLRQALYDIPKK